MGWFKTSQAFIAADISQLILVSQYICYFYIVTRVDVFLSRHNNQFFLCFQSVTKLIFTTKKFNFPFKINYRLFSIAKVFCLRQSTQAAKRHTRSYFAKIREAVVGERRISTFSFSTKCVFVCSVLLGLVNKRRIFRNE